MTVYVDLLFGLNTVINFLLLRGSGALGGTPVRFWRLALAAALGGLYAVATVLPGLEFLQRGMYQGVCAGLMLLLAFGWKRNTIKQALFFFALSFAFSGVVLLVVQMVEPDCVFLGGQAYYAVSMPAMLLLAGLCYAVAAFVLRSCGTHTGGDIIPVELSMNDRNTQLKALRDTGNTLHDPISGQSVLIVDHSIMQALLPEAAVAKAQLRDPAALMGRLSKQYPKCRFRLLSYRAVGVEDGLLLAVRCRGKISGKPVSVLAAFSPAELTNDGTFQALWGGEVQ